MRDHAHNVWQDLREKRLWPVALLLAVALVAVPVLLLKGTPEQAPPPVASAGKGPAIPLVASDQTSIAGSSELGSFDSKDPFRSLAPMPRVPGAAGAGTTDTATSDPLSGGGTLGEDLGL